MQAYQLKHDSELWGMEKDHDESTGLDAERVTGSALSAEFNSGRSSSSMLESA